MANRLAALFILYEGVIGMVKKYRDADEVIKATLEVPKDALSFDTFSVVYFLIGGLVIIGLDRIKMFLEKKHIEG